MNDRAHTDLDQAIERIRDYLVSQIKSLRSPNINAQIIQQRAFLAYKDLYAFLTKHHPQLAEEIGQAYSNTMRWYYLSHFTRYKQALEKMPLYTVDMTDALGADPNLRKCMSWSLGMPLAEPRLTRYSHCPSSRSLSTISRPPHRHTHSPKFIRSPFSHCGGHQNPLLPRNPIPRLLHCDYGQCIFRIRLHDRLLLVRLLLDTLSPVQHHLRPNLRARSQLHKNACRYYIRLPRYPPLCAHNPTSSIRAPTAQMPCCGRVYQRHKYASLATVSNSNGRSYRLCKARCRRPPLFWRSRYLGSYCKQR